MVLKDVFSVDPPRGVIHIIVKMPTPTPATTGKRKLDLDDVNEDQDRKKSKLTVPEKILTSSQKIMEDIKKLPDDPNVYSNPENLISLPFPFIGERRPVERFSIRDNKFLYMGRKAFDKVLKTINELESGNGYMDFFIYGTMGYGKSYILATIVCFLLKTKRRVVYLPDCRELEQEEQLYFIVDQMNALDSYNDTGIDDLLKKKIKSSLNEMSINHYYIKSSSANNTSALHLSIKQANKKKIELYGGFDENEMTQWWKKHVDLPLMNQQQREETEYITG
ncbi:hypothetical protein GLOIN_2v692305 [Rhizophagus irregularis DAOM 181602=DAOM 197198]|uniref:Uncharacterized protein n=1 Tax=Rhizophagus irregularis (strain DAOM 181602 / DAOM 197198 / MUCL 43194) TaxID=747089 RepID=A0A2P4QKF4_RHIID|nr:hypothetical protein GLOIN_2v692305 [Rhizophagus irregularis DAOM 181602=DAOM 197198]POG78139.1 hypothetical protein GLOIN_2v692305 [Rhizophagus irregularis DAOM 181602=DAOM 197198]|eukprot:XP_025185005.1 hypothetical protein GLOIN_2v692305 [Rhizophagus irregularis DAOM 181602=DAOM 197198]